MRFNLDFQLDNAAFDTDHPEGKSGAEIARILRGVADMVEGVPLIKNDSGYVKDVNGNTVGAWYILDRPISEG